MNEKNENTPTFEEALARLEAIADDIERGKIGLEESITRYEEGMKLVHRCREILAQAEQRIVRLQADATPDAENDNTKTHPDDAPRA